MSPCDASLKFVIDLGAGSVRLGDAGAALPQKVVPASALSYAYNLHSSASVLDEEVMEDILADLPSLVGNVHSARPSLLLSTPNAASPSLRRILTERALEVGAASVALLPSAVASAVASGRAGGLVVDIGAGLASVSPVVRGQVQRVAVREHPYAGNALDEQVLHALRHQGVHLKSGTGAAGSADRKRRKIHGRLPFSALRLAQDLKETVCFCAHVPLASLPPDEPYRHTLPDGQVIEVTSFSRPVPETLLLGAPSLDAAAAEPTPPFPGVPSLVAEALASLESPTNTSEVLLVGGSSRFVNFKDRLQTALAASGITKVNVLPHRYASWLGLSMAASLGQPLVRYYTKAELEEVGDNLFS